MTTPFAEYAAILMVFAFAGDSTTTSAFAIKLNLRYQNKQIRPLEAACGA